MKTFFLFIFLLLSTVASAQEFRNLDFSALCDTSKTNICFWDLSWGGKMSVQPDKIGNEFALRIQGKSAAAVGFTEQTVEMPPAEALRIITISANIKTDSVNGKGAGLNIGLYDANGQLVANKDMGGFYSIDWVTGSREWKKYSISIVCPVAVSKVKIGAILYGSGTAWFKDYHVSVTKVEGRKSSRKARKYVNAAIDIISKNSLVRDSLNLPMLRSTALQIAGRAKNYKDCFLAITYLLESLREYGDHHSFFMKADEVRNWETAGSQVSKVQFASGKLVEGNIGYIAVPPFHGGNQQQILAFADSLQKIIKSLHATGIKGWIIDLSQNTGGNMSPMVAGLGPLFTSDTLGYLVDVNQKKNGWYYKKGKYYFDDEEGWHVSTPVIISQLPIAVLTSNQTGSSGEAVAISFIGNRHTRSFGTPTWGLTTGNGSFALPDGSQIFLASTIMADRTGKLYPAGISPDQPVKGTTDDMIRAAAAWIRQYKK